MAKSSKTEMFDRELPLSAARGAAFVLTNQGRRKGQHSKRYFDKFNHAVAAFHKVRKAGLISMLGIEVQPRDEMAMRRVGTLMKVGRHGVSFRDDKEYGCLVDVGMVEADYDINQDEEEKPMVMKDNAFYAQITPFPMHNNKSDSEYLKEKKMYEKEYKATFVQQLNKAVPCGEIDMNGDPVPVHEYAAAPAKWSPPLTDVPDVADGKYNNWQPRAEQDRKRLGIHAKHGTPIPMRCTPAQIEDLKQEIMMRNATVISNRNIPQHIKTIQVNAMCEDLMNAHDFYHEKDWLLES